MKSKVREKEVAIRLRKKGCSYNDILRHVDVSRSTLSVWLKDLSLTQEEKASLRHRRDSNITTGRIKAAAANRRNRLLRTQELFNRSKDDFAIHKESSFFHAGLALYWAEGAKRNSYFSFSNSDVNMVELMVRWMEMFLHIDRSTLHIRLYIHKPYAHENCEQFWADRLGVKIDSFKKTIYKPTGKLIKKRPQYKGVLRISTNIEDLRKMQFWIQMLIEHHAKQ